MKTVARRLVWGLLILGVGCGDDPYLGSVSWATGPIPPDGHRLGTTSLLTSAYATSIAGGWHIRTVGSNDEYGTRCSQVGDRLEEGLELTLTDSAIASMGAVPVFDGFPDDPELPAATVTLFHDMHFSSGQVAISVNGDYVSARFKAMTADGVKLDGILTAPFCD